MYHCQQEMIYVSGYLTCTQCGLVNMDQVQFLFGSPQVYHSKYYPYKRSKYFRSKLYLITGKKQCWNTERYQTALNIVKEYSFSTISELHSILTKHNLVKMRKYIYNLFADIKGKRVIKISQYQQDRILFEYKKFDHWYRTHVRRRNGINYNSVIYYLCKRNNVNNYHEILLPRNSRITLKVIENYFNNLTN